MDKDDTRDELRSWLEEPTETTPNDSPTWQNLAAAGSLFRKTIGDVKQQNDGIERVKTFAAAMLVLSEDTHYKHLATKGFGLALGDLEDLVAAHPEIAPKIFSAATNLMVASHCIVTGNALKRHEKFSQKVAPLALVNAAKAAAIERAQAIAAQLWEADAAQAIRLGEMADKVYRALVAEGFTESLPGTTESLKEWIKPVAPDYARKPGRSRKSPGS